MSITQKRGTFFDAETVKQSADIVAVVREYVSLQRAGSADRFRALCPFHEEKTPSFYVNAKRQRFKCFGCDKSGDVIAFVQGISGASFKEALETLAERFGVPGTTVSPEEKHRYVEVQKQSVRLAQQTADFAVGLLLLLDEVVTGLTAELDRLDLDAQAALSLWHKALFVLQRSGPETFSVFRDLMLGCSEATVTFLEKRGFEHRAEGASLAENIVQMVAESVKGGQVAVAGK